MSYSTKNRIFDSDIIFIIHLEHVYYQIIRDNCLVDIIRIFNLLGTNLDSVETKMYGKSYARH